MTKKDQPEPTQKVILEYPYRVFGYLQVTETQLIFKRYWPGFNTFSGVINISDLEEIRYIKKMSLFDDPGLEIIYRLPNNQLREIHIYFESFSVRLGVMLRSGLTSEKVFETIEALKNSMT